MPIPASTSDRGPMDPRLIRNFCIIAHIDHGKTTLSDRILELTGALSKREMSDQVLDGMDLERERGITIKAHAVALEYRADDGNTYRLNLIDTPGHVDFAYEVSRSLSACEGAVLVVDASQGRRARPPPTSSWAATPHLTVLPVITKIDRPSAEPMRVKDQIENIIGLSAQNAILCSAKEGTGVREILEVVVREVPSPKGDPEGPPKALVFDSWFDAYRGVVILVRVIDGTLRRKMRIRLMATGRDYDLEDLGLLTPKLVPVDSLSVGEVGFLIANIRNSAEVKIGDTVTDARNPAVRAFPGFQEMRPMVFAGLFPIGESSYDNLRDALDKLRLNDSSFTWEPETSEALGFGFRCGIQKELKYVTTSRVLITYELPFNEVVLDFYDKLKTLSRGYASLDYHHTAWWESDLVKLDILVNGEPVDALSLIVHRERAAQKGRALAQKLREVIPRQLFEVAIQAAIGSRIVARENVAAMRKNVLAKCYGGDITRKRKLLEKQKEGKKRMKKVGRGDIPQEAFLPLLKVGY